jgi:copper(I)-binding protein
VTRGAGRLRVGVGGLLLASAAVAPLGCGGGLGDLPPPVGGEVRVGDVVVRDPRLEAPPPGGHRAGTDVRLDLRFGQEASEPEFLVDVTTPAARDAVLLRDATGSGAFVPVERLPVPVAVPPGGAPEPASAYVQLRDLTAELRPGEPVQVTLTFARAGTTTLLVPVATADAAAATAG